MDIYEYHKQFLEENPKHNIAEQISLMVLKARTEANLTQVELAKKMKTKQASIARAESKNPKFTPSLNYLRRVALAVGKELKLPEIL